MQEVSGSIPLGSTNRRLLPRSGLQMADCDTSRVPLMGFATLADEVSSAGVFRVSGHLPEEE
jgi:hypothetical protein